MSESHAAGRRARITAAAAVMTLFCYYEIYRWVPLYRWNGRFAWSEANDQFIPDILIGILLLRFAWAFWRDHKWGQISAVALLGLWSVVHFFDWWLPYLRDDPANAARYSFYSSHTQILPVLGHHYPPDAGHAVLDFLVYPTFVLCAFALTYHRNRPASACIAD